MKVAYLISLLSELPPEAEVFVPTGEFQGDEGAVVCAVYRLKSRRGTPANSVLIDWQLRTNR